MVVSSAVVRRRVQEDRAVRVAHRSRGDRDLARIRGPASGRPRAAPGGCRSHGDAVAREDRRRPGRWRRGSARRRVLVHYRPRGPAPVVTVWRGAHRARAHTEGGQAAQAVGGDLGLAAVGVDEAHAHAAAFVRYRRTPSAPIPMCRSQRRRAQAAGSAGASASGHEQEVVPQAVRLGHAHQRRRSFQAEAGAAGTSRRRGPSRPARPALAHRIPPSAVRYTPWSVPTKASAPGVGGEREQQPHRDHALQAFAERRPRAARVLAAEEPAVAGGVQERAQPDEIGDAVAGPTRTASRSRRRPTIDTRPWLPPPRTGRDRRRRTTTAPSPAPRPRAAPRPGR